MAYIKKGRPCGQRHHRAALSDEKVREMRQDRQRHGLSYGKLATKYGCGESTARDITNYFTRIDV